jgi:hypothetical protein
MWLGSCAARWRWTPLRSFNTRSTTGSIRTATRTRFPAGPLVETQPPDHEPTHVRLNWLHESGLLADPLGNEGADLWKAPGEAPGIDFSTESWRQQGARD